MKVVVVGNGGIGKTRWVTSLLNGSGNYKPYQEGKYTPTQGVEVHPYCYNNKVYKIWDLAGDSRYRGLADGYYINATHFIVIADNQEQASPWISEIQRVSDAPIKIYRPDRLMKNPQQPFIELN